MKDSSDIKDEIKQIDKQLEDDITMPYDEQIRLRASRNSLARQFNRKKSFYQRSIPSVY